MPDGGNLGSSMVLLSGSTNILLLGCVALRLLSSATTQGWV